MLIDMQQEHNNFNGFGVWLAKVGTDVTAAKRDQKPADVPSKTSGVEYRIMFYNMLLWAIIPV